MARGKKLIDDLIAFTLAISLIALAMSAVAIVSVRSTPNILQSAAPQPSHQPSGSAIVQLFFTLYGRVVNLQAGISGHGINISVPINTYYPETVGSTTVAANNSPSGAAPATYPYANIYSEYSVVFPDLAPGTYYNVTLYGVISPYCPPGSFCVLALVPISQHAVVQTGASGTVTNVTFALG